MNSPMAMTKGRNLFDMQQKYITQHHVDSLSYLFFVSRKEKLYKIDHFVWKLVRRNSFFSKNISYLDDNAITDDNVPLSSHFHKEPLLSSMIFRSFLQSPHVVHLLPYPKLSGGEKFQKEKKKSVIRPRDWYTVAKADAATRYGCP